MPDLVLKQKCKSLLTDDGRWMPSDGNSSPGLSSLSILFQFYHGSQFYWFRKPEYLERITILLKI